MKKMTIIFLTLFVLTMSSALADFSTDLALYYNFSQTTGNILDSSPSGVNANDYEINSMTATGILGNGYDFEATGRDDYIQIPYTAVLNRNANDHFTYNIWIKPESLDESFFFPGKCNYATGWAREICWGYNQVLNQTFSFICFADDGGGAGQCTDESSNYYAHPLTLNEWQMMTFAYNGTSLNVYRNGVLINARAYTGNIFDDTTADAVTTFSKMHSSEPYAGTANFDGIADELGFWKRGMQQDEVQSLYQTYLEGCDPTVNITGCSPLPPTPPVQTQTTPYFDNFNDGVCAPEWRGDITNDHCSANNMNAWIEGQGEDTVFLEIFDTSSVDTNNTYIQFKTNITEESFNRAVFGYYNSNESGSVSEFIEVQILNDGTPDAAIEIYDYSGFLNGCGLSIVPPVSFNVSINFTPNDNWVYVYINDVLKCDVQTTNLNSVEWVRAGVYNSNFSFVDNFYIGYEPFSLSFSEFTGPSTNNLNEELNLSQVQLTLENSAGMIEWTPLIDLTTYQNLDSYVEISQNSVFIDSNAMPNLNYPARISFYNANFNSAQEFSIMKDGKFCNDCTIAALGAIVEVDVPGFSNYTLLPCVNATDSMTITTDTKICPGDTYAHELFMTASNITLVLDGTNFKYNTSLTSDETYVINAYNAEYNKIVCLNGATIEVGNWNGGSYKTNGFYQGESTVNNNGWEINGCTFIGTGSPSGFYPAIFAQTTEGQKIINNTFLNCTPYLGAENMVFEGNTILDYTTKDLSVGNTGGSNFSGIIKNNSITGHNVRFHSADWFNITGNYFKVANLQINTTNASGGIRQITGNTFDTYGPVDLVDKYNLNLDSDWCGDNVGNTYINGADYRGEDSQRGSCESECVVPSGTLASGQWIFVNNATTVRLCQAPFDDIWSRSQVRWEADNMFIQHTYSGQGGTLLFDGQTLTHIASENNSWPYGGWGFPILTPEWYSQGWTVDCQGGGFVSFQDENKSGRAMHYATAIEWTANGIPNTIQNCNFVNGWSIQGLHSRIGAVTPVVIRNSNFTNTVFDFSGNYSKFYNLKFVDSDVAISGYGNDIQNITTTAGTSFRFGGGHMTGGNSSWDFTGAISGSDLSGASSVSMLGSFETGNVKDTISTPTIAEHEVGWIDSYQSFSFPYAAQVRGISIDIPAFNDCGTGDSYLRVALSPSPDFTNELAFGVLTTNNMVVGDNEILFNNFITLNASQQYYIYFRNQHGTCANQTTGGKVVSGEYYPGGEFVFIDNADGSGNGSGSIRNENLDLVMKILEGSAAPASCNQPNIFDCTCVNLVSDVDYTGRYLVCSGEHSVKGIRLQSNAYMQFQPNVTVTGYSVANDGDAIIDFVGDNATLDCGYMELYGRSGGITGWYSGDGSPMDLGGQGTRGINIDLANTYNNKVHNCNVFHNDFNIFTWWDQYDTEITNVSMDDSSRSSMHGGGNNGKIKNLQLGDNDNWFLIGRNQTITDSYLPWVTVGRGPASPDEDNNWGSLRAYNNTMFQGNIQKISDDGLIDIRENYIPYLEVNINDPEYLDGTAVIAANQIDYVDDFNDYNDGIINWCDVPTLRGNRYTGVYSDYSGNADPNLGTCNCDYINSEWTCTLTHDVSLGSSTYNNANIQTNANNVALNCAGTKFIADENNNTNVITFAQIGNDNVKLVGCEFEGYSRLANLYNGAVGTTFDSIRDNHRAECFNPPSCTDIGPGPFLQVANWDVDARDVLINNSYISGEVQLDIAGKNTYTWGGDYCADSSDQYVPNSDLCGSWDYVTNGATEPECAPGMWNANLSRCEDSRMRYAGGNCIAPSCSGNVYYFNGYWYNCNISDVAPLNLVIENNVINRTNSRIAYGSNSWDGRANRFFEHSLFPFVFAGEGVTIRNNKYYWPDSTAFEDPIDGPIIRQHSLVTRLAGIKNGQYLNNEVYGGKAALSSDGLEWDFPNCPDDGLLSKGNYAVPKERGQHGLLETNRNKNAIFEDNIVDVSGLFNTGGTLQISGGNGNLGDFGNITMRNNKIIGLDADWGGYMAWWEPTPAVGIYIYNNEFNSTSGTAGIAVGGNNYNVEFYNNTVDKLKLQPGQTQSDLDVCKGGIGNKIKNTMEFTVLNPDVEGWNFTNTYTLDAACPTLNLPDGFLIFNAEGAATEVHLDGNGVLINGSGATGLSITSLDGPSSIVNSTITNFKVRGYDNSIIADQWSGYNDISFADVNTPYYDYGNNNIRRNFTMPAPQITLASPVKGIGQANFNFTVYTDGMISTCKMFVNSNAQINETGIWDVNNNKTTTFVKTVTGLAGGAHNWYVTCTDEMGFTTTTSLQQLLFQQGGGGIGGQQGQCVDMWYCNEWSACTNSYQTRNCIDLNNCQTTAPPSTLQTCNVFTDMLSRPAKWLDLTCVNTALIDSTLSQYKQNTGQVTDVDLSKAMSKFRTQEGC